MELGQISTMDQLWTLSRMKKLCRKLGSGSTDSLNCQPCRLAWRWSRNERRLQSMRKLFLLTLMLLLYVTVMASDNEEGKIKAAVEDRYKEWLAAANQKDAAALTNLYDENAVLMPKEEEPVIGKATTRRVLQEACRRPAFCAVHADAQLEQLPRGG